MVRQLRSYHQHDNNATGDRAHLQMLHALLNLHLLTLDGGLEGSLRRETAFVSPGSRDTFHSPPWCWEYRRSPCRDSRTSWPSEGRNNVSDVSDRRARTAGKALPCSKSANTSHSYLHLPHIIVRWYSRSLTGAMRMSVPEVRIRTVREEEAADASPRKATNLPTSDERGRLSLSDSFAVVTLSMRACTCFLTMAPFAANSCSVVRMGYNATSAPALIQAMSSERS
jgi:hypothetical protein